VALTHRSLPDMGRAAGLRLGPSPFEPSISNTVNVHEAKPLFSRLLERAHQGEEIILAKAGKP